MLCALRTGMAWRAGRQAIAAARPALPRRGFAYLKKKDTNNSSSSATSTAASASAATPAAADGAPTAPRKPLYGKRAPASGSGASADSTFDLIIVGAGSGGLALSKEASRLGQRVLVLDYVDPSPRGSKWGLGGTCVNVGCIPKKLMHQAAIVGEHVREAHEWGWGLAPGANQSGEATAASANADADSDASAPAPIVVKHNWSALVSAVQLYIKSLNFGYRSRLQKDPNIVYANARGKLLSARSVQATDASGNARVYTARKHVVIAVGGRPRYPDIPGAREYGMTSDDIFSLPRAPGRTLIVGAGYIALETASFLSSLSFPSSPDNEVHVMARSKYLRGFDQDISAMIVRHMGAHGVTFRDGFIPTRLERAADGSDKVRVTFSDTKPGDGLGSVHTEEFDTVLFAIGRDPCTQQLGLQEAGVEMDRSGKILLGDGPAATAAASTTGTAAAAADRDPDETTAPGVFALGDVGQNRPELTPVAISSAKLLARRLYAPKDPPGDAVSHRYRTLDYGATPTTVFTSLEYSCVGWSEEFAASQLGGPEHLEVFHSHFRPLEWTVPHREDNACYVKIICQQLDADTAAHIASISDPAAKHHASLRAMRRQRVVGLHFLGPNAGEVMQGFAVAFQKGLTREDIEYAIGIHPTVAEELLTADITKSSGEDPQKSGC